ncbi:hypothetical protein Q8A67_002213 [Cirrhinus molitorella]|uniref:Uncharacterized protein n=1 Tax=Cirrhinus molitorella TaxID=172907 RepID=A0AA88QHM7_9TELE|nr:hypothetical protein Q8A67_002213 [Cirrhinus molitorella]
MEEEEEPTALVVRANHTPSCASQIAFPASVPSPQRERMKVLLQCGAHQWKAVEEHCRDAEREKKKKK